MSRNIEQIYTDNPASSMDTTDLLYLGRSPYNTSDDFGITFDNFQKSITQVGTLVNLTVTGNTSSNNFVPGYTTTATAAGTTVLTVSSTQLQYFTGSTTQTVTLPVVSTLALGFSFTIVNNSSGVVTINSSGGNLVVAMASETQLVVTCILTSGTTAASWDTDYTADIVPVPLSEGGTSANLTASVGGIFYSGASAGAILAGTATANRVLLSGSSAAPAWSTATYPATTTINQLLYSSSNNVVSGISTANDGVLITSNAGIPSWLANSGTPGFVLTANSGAPPSWQASAGSGTVNSGTQNQLAWYATTGTAVSGLATANNGILVTSGGGVPSIANSVGADLLIHSVLVGQGHTAGVFNTFLAASSGGSITGSDNVLIGYQAGTSMVNCIRNVAIGSGAFASADNSTDVNVAIGYSALSGLSGSNLDNVALGAFVLQNLASGSFNTSLGANTLADLSSGSANTVIGYNAGALYSGAESSNILIGYNVGAASESHVLRIGSGTGTSTGQLNKAFIAGINAVTVSSPAYVTIDTSTNQLGTTSIGGGGLIWASIAGTTQAAAVGRGYIVANASQTTVTLPATCAIGDTVAVRGLGAAGFILAANTGQTIKAGSQTTSSGGSLTSAEQYDNINVQCIEANTTWTVSASGPNSGFTYA